MKELKDFGVIIQGLYNDYDEESVHILVQLMLEHHDQLPAVYKATFDTYISQCCGKDEDSQSHHRGILDPRSYWANNETQGFTIKIWRDGVSSYSTQWQSLERPRTLLLFPRNSLLAPLQSQHHVNRGLFGSINECWR